VSQRVDADGRKSRPARREDAISAIVVLALAALILIGGLRIPDSSYANAVLSPRDFPWLIGLLMAVAGIVLLLRNASALMPNRDRSKIKEESKGATAADASGPVASEPTDSSDDVLATGRPAQDPRILGLLLLLLLGYILVFVWLGFVLSTFLFLASAAMLLAPKRPIRNVIYAAALSIAVYLLFTVGLNVLLPPGPLGGLL
jgi:putative tricarboxylic transport membrane protein